MSPRFPLFLAAALAHLSAPVLAQTPPPSDPVLDAGRDPRLARRIILRSEGMYVSHVLRRLSAKSGISLSVSGRAGDERMVAFVPKASLAEILASIADLYNLKWGRASKDGKVSYQLFKPPARIRQETQLKEKALREGFAELDRQARELPKSPTLRQPHRLALRKAAIALARENWQRLTEDGQLVFLLKDLPAERRASVLTHARTKLLENQQIALEHDREHRQRYLDNGEELPDYLKEEPQTRPLGDPDTWRLTIELNLKAGVELVARLHSENFASGFFHSSAHQGEALGLSVYEDRSPRPAVPPAQDPPLPQEDPFSKPLFAPKAPPIKPTDPPNQWLNALENLSIMGSIAVYSDDYSNPENGGDRQAAQPPFNGQPAQACLDQLCFLTVAKPANFWWRRGSTAFIRSRSYLHEADSLLPAAFTDRLLSRQSKDSTIVLFPDDLLFLRRLTLPQLNAILTFRAHEGWKRAVQIPARLSPPSQSLLLSRGLRWELLPRADQLLAQQLSLANHSVGPDYFARVSAAVSPPGSGSRSAIQIRLETDLTPGSSSGAFLPAPQSNPQGLIVTETAN